MYKHNNFKNLYPISHLLPRGVPSELAAHLINFLENYEARMVLGDKKDISVSIKNIFKNSLFYPSIHTLRWSIRVCFPLSQFSKKIEGWMDLEGKKGISVSIKNIFKYSIQSINSYPEPSIVGDMLCFDPPYRFSEKNLKVGLFRGLITVETLQLKINFK